MYLADTPSFFFFFPFGEILACHNNGLVTVPIGSKSSSSHVDHVIKTSGLQVLAVDRPHLDQVIPLIKGTNIQLLVLSDGDKVDGNLDAVYLKDIIEKGKSSTAEPVLPGKTTNIIHWIEEGIVIETYFFYLL